MKVNTKLKLENGMIPPKQQEEEAVMAPSSLSLPRSGSELADTPSPYGSNAAHHHPVSVPTSPGALPSCSPFGRMRSLPADTPRQKPKPTPTPTAAAAAYYTSMWSPRRLMQRAARAFRRSRSRSRVRTVKDLAEERASVLNNAAKVSDAGGADNAGVQGEQRHDDYCHHEIVPEKIIHETNHHHAPAPAVVRCGKKETAAAAAAAVVTEVEEVVESHKKGAAPAPEVIVVDDAAAAAAEDMVVADKFVTVVKEAIKKQEAIKIKKQEVIKKQVVIKKQEAKQDEKKGAIKKQQVAEAEHDENEEEAMRRFQGSRVKTAMEARPESEQPRRREVVRSNDVIEEARTKLLHKCSRVKALVGAFETVMDTNNKDAVAVTAAAAGKPQHQYRKSV